MSLVRPSGQGRHPAFLDTQGADRQELGTTTSKRAMARPLSEEKRDALLVAARAGVATSGVKAATAHIAREAGVAEGTLFVFFETKDALFNELFLSLKSDLADYIDRDLPRNAAPIRQIRHMWDRYIDSGIAQAEHRAALRQLNVSDRISAATREAGNARYLEFASIYEQGFATGLLRKQPLEFLGRVINAIAEAVQDAIAADPASEKRIRRLGWEALRNAIAAKEASGS